ncbi:MAG TPA: hypothetical protein VD978_10215 [Azospirillum sp.]|nr:hypothetical protein [Azospirillum sp.]
MHRTRPIIGSASPSFRRRLRAASALIMAGAIAGVSLPAAAAPKACYTRPVHAAEQMIRLHTEMMITGLTCQQVMPDKAPFAKYREFTNKNRTILSKAEGQLIEHFRKQAKGNATSRFDTYRTEVANEVSRRASIIGTDNYCKTFVPRVETAMSLTLEDLHTLTADEKNAGLMHLSQQPLCDVKVVSVPDGAPVLASAEPARGKSKKGGKTTPATAAKPAAAKPGKAA